MVLVSTRQLHSQRYANVYLWLPVNQKKAFSCALIWLRHRCCASEGQILKHVSEEMNTMPPPHSLPWTSVSAAQTIYDLKGRSLLGDANAIYFITFSYV